MDGYDALTGGPRASAPEFVILLRTARPGAREPSQDHEGAVGERAAFVLGRVA